MKDLLQKIMEDLEAETNFAEIDRQAARFKLEEALGLKPDLEWKREYMKLDPEWKEEDTKWKDKIIAWVAGLKKARFDDPVTGAACEAACKLLEPQARPAGREPQAPRAPPQGARSDARPETRAALPAPPPAATPSEMRGAAPQALPSSRGATGPSNGEVVAQKPRAFAPSRKSDVHISSKVCAVRQPPPSLGQTGPPWDG